MPSTLQVGSSSIIGSWRDAQNKLARELEREAEGRELLLQLQTLNREAFRGDLIRVLVGGPSVDEIKAYAAKQPDRWAQMLAVVARLAGYSERPEDGASLVSDFAQIGALSDAELLERLESIDGKLDIVVGRKVEPPAIVDGEYRTAEPEAAERTTAEPEAAEPEAAEPEAAELITWSGIDDLLD